MALGLVAKTFKPATIYDSTSEITTGEGWVTLCEILNTELVAGHRYLIFAQSHFLVLTIGHNNYARLNIGGTPDAVQQTSFARNGSVQLRAQSQFCCVRTPTAGQSIKLETSSLGGSTYVHHATLAAIDLDSDGMLENVDWFVAQDTTPVVNPSFTISGATAAASLTFTPDGVSNYWAVCGALMDNRDTLSGTVPYGVLLQDAGLDVNLAQHSNIDTASGASVNQAQGVVLSRILETPATSPFQLEVRHHGSGRWRHAESNLIVFRLEKFLSYAYDQDDTTINLLRYLPPNAFADPARNQASFTPDIEGKAFFFCWGEHRAADDDNGYCHQLRFGDPPSGPVAYTSEWEPYGDGAIQRDDGIQVTRNYGSDDSQAVFGFGTLEGLTPTVPVDTYLYMARRGGSLPSVKRSNLVVLGTATTEPIVSIGTVVALSSTRVRVNFDQPMKNDAALVNPSNYVVQPQNPAGAGVSVSSVVAEVTTEPNWVDLTVTEMTDGEDYEVTASTDVDTGPKDTEDEPINPLGATAAFTGIGVAPQILRVEAVGANRIDVVFTELMEDNPDLRNPSKYTFDKGLATTNVLDVVGDTVKLITSTQTPGTLYTMTINQ